MIREVDYNPQEKLIKGIDKLATAVASTMGPKGTYVMYDTTMGPKTTKDGITVVSRFALEDMTEHMGATMLVMASAKTADNAGDGSTSAVVMAAELIKAATKDNRAKILIKKELEEDTNNLLELLEGMATPIELDPDKDNQLVLDIATLAANNDKVLGQIVHDSYKTAGKYGLIMVEDGKTLKTTIENKDGYSFKRSFMSPYFVTDPKTMTTEYDETLVCLFDKKVRFKEEIIPLLEIAAQNKKPVLLICEALEGEALTLVLTNLMQHRVRFCAVECPGYGLRRKEILEDIALITNGTLIDNDLSLSLKDIKISHLGVAKKILVDKTSTTLFVDKDEDTSAKIQERIDTLEAQLKNKDINTYEKDTISKRMATLASKLVVIKVGGSNPVEVNEIRDRLDDSIRAVRSALELGIVPGCGKAYHSLAILSNSSIMRTGLKSIMKTVLKNANIEYETVAYNPLFMSDPYNTYDVFNDVVDNYIKLGIVEPAKVVREVIQNSVSVAIQVIMTSVVIQEDKDKQKDTTFDLDDIN